MEEIEAVRVGRDLSRLSVEVGELADVQGLGPFPCLIRQERRHSDIHGHRRARFCAPRRCRRMGASRACGLRMRRTENANLGTAVTNPATDAMALGTEVVAGAIEAGGKIVAATADMAESAVRTAAAVTTGVVSEESQEDEARSKRRGGRTGS
jgi:hypothetical protein